MNVVRMWPFKRSVRVENDAKTSVRTYDMEDVRTDVAQLKRQVVELTLDMDAMRNNVLRKIQRKRVDAQEEPRKKGGIVRPSELGENGLTQ